jgi:hypothetical protein
MYLKERLICFFKSIENCNESIELVMVEWNPPQNSKSFLDEFGIFFPKNKKIKIVTVPNIVHSKIKNNEHFPVFEYIAKNCGARHSSGEYILFTNPDNIFIGELWDELFSSIDSELFLRAGRCDIEHGVIEYESLPIDEILIKSKILNKYTYNDGLFYEASGDFLCISKENFYKAKGYEEIDTYSHIDSLFLDKINQLGVKQKVLSNYTYHIEHSRPNLLNAINLGLVTNYNKINFSNDDNWGLKNEKLNIEII